MIIFDSDIWIAYLSITDSQHQKAEKIFAELERNNTIIVVPEYVAIEVITVLRRLKVRAAAQFVHGLVHNNALLVLPRDPVVFQSACTLVYSGAHPKLSFTDLSLLIMSHSYEVKSFDKALLRALGAFAKK